MELKNILNELRSINGGGLEKTAAAQAAASVPTEKVSTARDELVRALDSALTTQAEKTAAAPPAESPSATGSLVKMASDLAASESEALTKEAQFYGAAVCDGFMSRLGQYEESTRGKTAGADTPTEEEFNKFAAENPELVKQAAEVGYRDGMQQVEQLKLAALNQGFTDAMVQIEELAKTAEGQEKLAAVAAEVNGPAVDPMIEKLASTPEGRAKLADVEQGYNEAMNDIQKLASTPEGQEKLAAIKQGYADASQEITKIASDCYTNGYQNTIRLLQAM